MSSYKRILYTSNPKDLMTYRGSDLDIRPVRHGRLGEFVLESEYGTERKHIDKLVALFNEE